MSLAGRVVVAAAVVVAAGGCSPPAGDPALSEVFARFPPCERPVGSGTDADEIEGLALPDDAVITATNRNGPVTDVAAYVPRTPLDVRALYEAQDEFEVLQIEDETFETEVLLADGDFRTYLMAKVACREGSHISAFVAPAHAVEAIPTPAGGTGANAAPPADPGS